MNICHQVEEDFKKFPQIKTTEDFFIWRELIKKRIEEKTAKRKNPERFDEEYIKTLRTNFINYKIEDNDSLKFLNAWSKCDRTVTNTKALIRTINDYYGIEDNDHVLKATDVLHNYLVKRNKNNANDLSNLFQIPELNLLVKYQNYEFRPVHTPFEFERIIFKQDEMPWPAPLFVAALKSYGIEAEDLLAIEKIFLTSGKDYIENVCNQYGSASTEIKKYIYTIMNKE